jgi:single-stranded-DNA-specific exonuclease
MVIVNKYLEQIGKDASFLNPELPEEFGISLTGINDGVDLIRKHIKENNKIVVYTDYDCDGTTGAVILDLTFRSLGYNNYVVLMNERIFGNGINQTTVDTIKGILPVGLVITSDHGSSNDNYIKMLRDMNVDVIITDHHHLKDNKPPIYANVFINPQQETNDMYKSISGGATTFALAKQLLKDHPNEYLYMDNLLELTAISTIGDMMDMTNEINRNITKLGMEKLNSSKLGKAFRRAMKYPNEIMSRDISFTLVPMINSCSRVSTSALGYISLLPPKTIARNIANTVNYNHMSESIKSIVGDTIQFPKTWDEHQDDEAEIEHIVSNMEELKNVNLQRKKKQNDVMAEAIKQIDPDCPINMIIIKGGNGINGIVSSQVGNKTNKPTITFIYGTETCSGSCRGSIPTLDVKKCFDYIKDNDKDVFHIKEGSYVYGGHFGAGGCTVNTNKLEDFKRLFIQYMIDNKIEYIAPSLLDDPNIIDITNIHNLTEELSHIKQLEPFGNNLQPPKLKVKFDLIKNYKAFPINPDTKMIKFTGVIDDASIDCTMYVDRERDIEVRDAYIIGTMTFNKGPIFNIIDAIQQY